MIIGQAGVGGPIEATGVSGMATTPEEAESTTWIDNSGIPALCKPDMLIAEGPGIKEMRGSLIGTTGGRA